MRLPIKPKNQKGNGLVEAAMVMPLFLLAILMLISPIPAFSTWENALFSVSDEIRYECAKAAFAKQPNVMKTRVKQRIREENPAIEHFRIKSCKYMYREKDIGDLITVEYAFDHHGFDLFGLFGGASFETSVTGRAFTGKLHDYAPDALSKPVKEIVYLFPEWGMRYHKKTCTYIKSSCEMVYLSAATKKKYDPCNLCNAKSAQIGSPVFCFTRYGKVYHLDHCKTVDRYYITMEKEKARSEGYTPCLKCGG